SRARVTCASCSTASETSSSRSPPTTPARPPSSAQARPRQPRRSATPRASKRARRCSLLAARPGGLPLEVIRQRFLARRPDGLAAVLGGVGLHRESHVARVFLRLGAEVARI